MALVWAVLLAGFAWALPLQSEQWAGCEFTPGRLIVTFDPSVQFAHNASGSGDWPMASSASIRAMFEEFEVHSVRRLIPDGILRRLKVSPDFYDTYIVDFRAEYPVLDVLDRLAADKDVRRIEPDLIRRVFRTPNDALWNSQWDKRLMGAPAVWDVSTGSEDIICVGIDTGVDWNHPDLVPNLWVNPGEDIDGDRVPWTEASYPGDYDDLNGVDDDDDGYIDDFLGWDFIVGMSSCATGEDCDSQMDNDMFGVNGHGTHVGGIMAARGNNEIGVAGMCWNGTLMALRAGFENNQGEGLIGNAASVQAILYAAAHGARVINMSYGGGGSSPNDVQALNSAWAQGCILFAASGNDGSTEIQYPAGYENVIAVNATQDNDRLAWWSNRGTWTDICAPGASPGIMSTIINSYAAWEGTSMASPNAAGVAALVWSLFPNMTNAQLRDLLFDTAVDISGNNPNVPAAYLGHGRISAQLAAAALYPQMEITQFTLNESGGGDGDGRLERTETAEFFFYVTNVPGWANGDDISVTISADSPHLIVSNATIFLGDIGSGQTVNNLGNPVFLDAAADLDTAYWADLLATFSSPNGYEATQTLQIRIGRGTVLVVNDDGGQNYEQYYLNDVKTAGLASDEWNTQISGQLDDVEIGHYDAVIWSCGNETQNTLTAADQAVLTTYLDGGGTLMIVGQNIDEDLRGATFYADYLHAQSEDQRGERQLTGVGGSSISEGMSLLLQGGGCAGNGDISPSRILPLSGAEPLFTYNSGGVGAIAYAGTYNVAYFAFALEAACGYGETADHGTVTTAVLRWSGILATPPTSRVSALPQEMRLHGNYPNPFNPSTTITFDLAHSADVSLRVFDVLGRQVADLIHTRLDAGTHTAVFDGHSQASGIYIVQLSAGRETLSSRMVLLK
ncbi:MAG: S8 family serine peptidase [Calditrichota bacterium]